MIQTVYDQIAPYQTTLKSHRLYQSIQSIEHLMTFMSYHIYSVWDFMNLLKMLQLQLTSMAVPWVPVNSVENVRLINEIVLEEESDEIDGKITSHFLYYVHALQTLGGADAIDPFLRDLKSASFSYDALISRPYLSGPVQSFLAFTYDCIQSSPLHVAASFAYGRETLVPLLFEPLLRIRDLDPSVRSFISYLERHIELDGEQHGNLAEQMVANLCQSDDDWETVTQVSIRALDARLHFWDAIYKSL